VPTFIASVYGMNFDNMPELHWHIGYALALGLMALCVLALIAFFRRIDWL
jgi:magnesium transporter